jgi:hypothetical protein
MRRILGLLLLLPGWAQACLFATSTTPEGWHQWSKDLLGGEVIAVEKDAAKPIDIVRVKVAETFKGPDASRGTLTVRLSSRYWVNCKLEKPAVGSRVLVGINPHGDAMLVPLADGYAEQLRSLRARQPRP